MPIKLNISPKIIPSISSGYNNPNKIFMEYIDNSLDSAEKFYNPETNSYEKHIHISLKLWGSNDKEGIIEIQDNCTGIDNIDKVVTKIGNSDKKSNTFTNGQFGYGIHSFMATCNTLEVVTKFEGNKEAYSIPIQREQFDVDSAEDVLFPDPKVVSFVGDSGTIVRLSDFDKGSWKQVDLNEIKMEVVEHFELLLLRDNLTIELVDDHGIEHFCDSFDYSQIEGLEFIDEITELTQTSTRSSSPVKSLFKLDPPPIRTYIKITENRVINKPPLFFVKGRAIGKISDIYKGSKYKSALWNHPNITGYIDLAHHLEPTILRTDLKNDNKRRALFHHLEAVLEPQLLDFIDIIKQDNTSKHYQTLENELNKALSKLARIDSLNYRTEAVTGGDASLGIGSEGKGMEEGFGSKDRFDDKPNETNNPNEFGMNEGDGMGVGDVAGDLPGDPGDGNSPTIDEDNPFSDSVGSQRRKSGFNIRIVEQDPPTEIIDGVEKQLRSMEVDGSIIIFKNHPDFIERVDMSSRIGEPRVTQRLITYLAGEITVHYKDKFHTKTGQPDYNKQLFVNLVEFIYQFESMLKDLVNKNLSDVTDQE